MEKTVIISIKGTQVDEEGTPEVVEFITNGTLSDQPSGGYWLSYQESALTGLEGTTTTFHVEEGKITMERAGTLQSEMVFQEGEGHLSYYETTYGTLMMSIHTSRAHSTLGMEGGELEIRYLVEIEDTFVGENMVQITVRNKGSQISQM